MLHSDSVLKIKIIILPFMVLAAFIMILYPAACWLLFEYLKFEPVTPSMRYLFIPILLSSAGIYIFFRKRLNTLALESTIKLDTRLAYFVLPVLVIAIPTGLLQYHMDKKFGKLTVLRTASEISSPDSSKYYIIHRYYADKAHRNINFDFTYSKNGRTGYIHYLCLIPLRDTTTDVVDYSCRVYLAINQETEFDATLDDDEQNKLFEQFSDKCKSYIDSVDLQRFRYFENISYDDGIGRYKEGLGYVTKKTVPNPVILEGVESPYERRNDNFIALIVLSIIFLNLVFFIPIFSEDFSESGLASYRIWKNIRDPNNYM